ncbi:MAG: MBOAT family protein [Clostridia bacterium]|nr:MBOAT family protein [Clostridia bacterium]
MNITGLLFLFCFLPFSLVIYYIADKKAKEYVLLAISLCFYSLCSLRYLVLFILTMIVNIVIGRSISLADRNYLKRLLLIIGIAINAGILINYKYTNFIIGTFHSLSGENIPLYDTLLPMGISFFTFKAISYIADIYCGRAKLSANPVHDALYLSIFTQIQSGPLSRYNDLVFPGEYTGVRNARFALFSDGVFRFLIGFNKKILIADILSKITTEVFTTPVENYSMVYAWFGSICYSLQLFFDFAGYSDMAIGLSEMFGYKCNENFNFPYMTESVSKFWRRWHISLSEWFRDYVYIPLGGSRNKNRLLVYRNLFVVWLLTGIWHGASWNFVFWGMGYFVMICFERITKYPEKFKHKISKILYRVFSLIFINCQWIMFRSDSFVDGCRFIKKLFVMDNIGISIADYRAWFLFKDNLVFILAAVLLSFPVVKAIGKKLEGHPLLSGMYEVLINVIVLALFICALTFVVAEKNNPFTYANF